MGAPFQGGFLSNGIGRPAMSAPVISVIMPVFNAEPYLRAAIQSVLAQTFRDFELIIIDDASADGSLKIARSIRDERIVILENAENLGAAKTKNRALEIARGEYIAFLDADDIAMPERFAEQIDFSLRNPAVDIIGSQIGMIDEVGATTGISRWPCAPDDICGALLFENCVAQSSVMLRRALLSVERFRTEFEPAEDYDLWTRLSPGARFANLGYPLVKYRVHPSGVSARRDSDMQASVQSIHSAQLARLGLVVTPEQLDLHGRLSRWPFPPTREMVAGAEGWLRTLKTANSTARCFPEMLFSKAIAQRWYSICNDSWPLGIWAWKTWRKSSLAGPEWFAPMTHCRLLRRAIPASLKSMRSPA